jgi:hypothetical protein
MLRPFTRPGDGAGASRRVGLAAVRILVDCPDCPGRLSFGPPKRGQRRHPVALCPECGTAYQLHDGELRRA